MLETIPAHIPDIISIWTCDNRMCSLSKAAPPPLSCDTVIAVALADSAKATGDCSCGLILPPPGAYNQELNYYSRNSDCQNINLEQARKQ